MIHITAPDDLFASLTKREFFAISMLQAMVARPRWPPGGVAWAVIEADMLIDALNQSPQDLEDPTWKAASN